MTRLSTLYHLLLFALLLSLATAQQQKQDGKDKKDFRPVQPESPEFEDREGADCNKTFRSIDGRCTNNASPLRQLWGSTNRPQFSYFSSRSTIVPRGMNLKSPREISNILFQSSQDVFDERGLNEMATFFGQFIDHNLVATPSNKSEPMPISIPSNDPTFGNATICNKKITAPNKGRQLAFFRSSRVRVKRKDDEQRPQNSLTSALDLVAVYGPTKDRNSRLRRGAGGNGLMATSAGDLMPLNRFGFNNAPDFTSRKFFFAGDHRANEHPVLTALHTIFLREHNSLAVELKKEFPSWGDSLLFNTARKINGAQFQKIVYKDWFPSVTGSQLPKYKKFKKKVDLTVSVVFSTAAFRVGHTMVGNHINRRGPKNKFIDPTPFCKMFFNSANLFRKKNILESFVRGAMVNRAQKVDLQVRNALRNFLFENVKGEDGFDLVAMNLQRGRDHALPSYNAVCTKFKLKKKTSFSQITKSMTVQSNLATAYGRIENVEAWSGMLAEDIEGDTSLPPCILKIWQREFQRIRDGDFFYYENGKQFNDEIMNKIQRVKDLFDNDIDTFKQLLLRHTNIKEKELPKKGMFFWK